MSVVKLVLKIVCIPIFVILTFIQMILAFLSAMTGWFFYLLALIIFITGVLRWGFGLESVNDSIKIIGIPFIVFFMPYILAIFSLLIELVKSFWKK